MCRADVRWPGHVGLKVSYVLERLDSCEAAGLERGPYWVHVPLQLVGVQSILEPISDLGASSYSALCSTTRGHQPVA
eukprot:1645157-Rhodomonas_salina.1